MSLSTYAIKELQLAGLFDANSDYEGMLGPAVLELIETFAAQGHSGGSAHMVIDLFTKLAKFEPLTAITSNPSEWMEVGPDVWQSTRKPSLFSKNGGITWYDINE